MNSPTTQNPSPSSGPVFYTSPGHLRAAAHLYGIETISLEKARVLELGCGSGENLFPFALAYPNAEVVGISLWQNEIEQGNKTMEGLGLQNLELHAQHFSDIDHSYGLFDYIIVHDEFAWAPPALREAILRICRENLSPLGIAYISYNTYPGWKAGDILRDAIQLHSHSASTIEEVQASAEAILTLMSNGLSQQHPQAESIKATAARLLQHPDYYINSDYLQASNASFYFLELADIAMQAGLAYVGDAQPQEELSATHGLNVQLNHSLLTLGQPKAMRQQYLDFAIGRDFRRSLFIHQERAAGILDNLDLSRLTDLRWACSLKRNGPGANAPGEMCSYLNHQGNVFTLRDDITIGICDSLGAAWPTTLDFQSLINCTRNIAPEIGDENQHKKAIQKALETLLKLGVLRYSLDPSPYDTASHDKLCLTPGIEYANACNNSKANEFITTNLWHEPVTIKLTAAQYALLSAFNGKNGLERIASHVEPATPILADTSRQEHSETADEYSAQLTVARLTDLLKWQGILLGSDAAWVSHYTAILKANAGTSIYRLQLLPPLVMHLISSNTNASRGGQLLNSMKAANKKAASQTTQTSTLISQIQQLRNQGKLEQAHALTSQFRTKHPHNAFSWHMTGILLHEMGRDEESLNPLLMTIALEPEKGSSYGFLAMALSTNGTGSWPRVGFQLALTLDPDNVPAWTNYGNWFRNKSNTAQAEACYRRAIALEPANSDVRTNLATVLADQGNISEALEYYRKVIKQQPDNNWAYSALLFAMSQDDATSPETLFKAHKAFGEKIEKRIKSNPSYIHPNPKDPNRTLRIGFVSGDLYHHAVASFIEPVWESLDKKAFEIYAYSNSTKEDDASNRLRGLVKSWQLVVGMSDTALASRIQQDSIDILVDLSGHTGHNRLSMFALKPAPIQISWIGYPGTTGLKAIDYYLVNKYQAPKGLLDNQFTEQLIRLPAAATFKPAPDSSDINPLPALVNGYFTFGSFNRLSKVNERILGLWARILHAVPNSRLLLGHIPPTLSSEIKGKLQAHGINTDRLILQPRVNMKEYLSLHHQVDLLLDTFPFNGGTTTVHGLWMGVPTLTLAGKTLPARTGAAAMAPIGLQQFIVESETDYLNSAISWSNKLTELAEIRSNMRERLLLSPSFSQTIMTRGLEKALKQAWSMWCDGKVPEAFEIEP